MGASLLRGILVRHCSRVGRRGALFHIMPSKKGKKRPVDDVYQHNPNLQPHQRAYSYSQQMFHTGWTQHGHALVQNFLRAADGVTLSPAQHSPVPSDERLGALEHMLGHLFTHKNLLLLALTHPSACAQGSPNSKVLSWMGDSALNLAITEQLAGSDIERVGDLTKARADLVSRSNCAKCAKVFGLGDAMIIGKGVMMNNGGPTDDMLGEAMEAVFGAVYVDGGMEAVRKAYGRNFPLSSK